MERKIRRNCLNSFVFYVSFRVFYVCCGFIFSFLGNCQYFMPHSPVFITNKHDDDDDDELQPKSLRDVCPVVA